MAEPSLLWTYTRSIPAKQWSDIPFQVPSVEGYFLFHVEVSQLPGRADDILVFVFDVENYKRLTSNRDAIRAGARPELLTKPTSLLFAKIYWGDLFFQPPTPGTYYLVLDNTHSFITAKTVTLKGYWMWSHSAWLASIRDTLMENKWQNVWALLEDAIVSFDQKKLIDCCNNLRMALITLWTKVCEKLDGRTITFEPGKTPDIGQLTDCLKRNNVTDDVASLIARHWSLISELAHVEKRSGEAPPENEASLAYNLTFATVSYLLTLIRRVQATPPKK